jgi:hypothetical protein
MISPLQRPRLPTSTTRPIPMAMATTMVVNTTSIRGIATRSGEQASDPQVQGGKLLDYAGGCTAKDCVHDKALSPSQCRGRRGSGVGTALCMARCSELHDVVT